jgi:hypothetical protein
MQSTACAWSCTWARGWLPARLWRVSHRHSVPSRWPAAAQAGGGRGCSGTGERKCSGSAPSHRSQTPQNAPPPPGRTLPSGWWHRPGTGTAHCCPPRRGAHPALPPTCQDGGAVHGQAQCVGHLGAGYAARGVAALQVPQLDGAVGTAADGHACTGGFTGWGVVCVCVGGGGALSVVERSALQLTAVPARQGRGGRGRGGEGRSDDCS